MTFGYVTMVITSASSHGAKGMLTAGSLRETTVEFAGAEGFVARQESSTSSSRRHALAYRSSFDAFVAAVEAGRKPSPSGEDGLAANRLADAACLSGARGGAVTLA